MVNSIDGEIAAPAASAIDVETAATVRGEVVDLLFAALPRALAVSFVNSLIAAYLLRDQTTSFWLWMWIVASVTVAAARVGLLVARRRGWIAATADQWHAYFLACAIASGLVWGSCAVVLMPTDSVGHQAFTGLFLAGMAAGAMASLAYCRISYASYVVAVGLPFSTAMLTYPSELQVMMGILTMLFMAAMIQGAKAFQKTLTDSILLRVSQERLAADLTQANARLRTEIDRATAAEAQMRSAKEQAIAANNAKSMFLANMSHEIRTPMNGVLGMTDLLLKTGLDTRQQRLANTIKSSGTMLLAIIEDVLDFSRIEAGKLKLTSERFPLEPCLRESIDLVSELAGKKGLDLKLALAPDLPRFAVGDAVRLRQLCVNLLGNAVKFTATGSVELSARAATQAGRPAMTIEVRDTGIGISAAALARILKPFEQADNSTSRKYGGTGLGLAICSNLIDMMGGRLDISSTPGKGTTVSFTIPLALEGHAGSGTPPTAPQMPGARRLLLATDESADMLDLRRTLERTACDVTAVGSGEAALDSAMTFAFDAILLDCRLPKLDALSVARLIRAYEVSQGRARIPILALSARSRERNAEEMRNAGIDTVIGRPCATEELADALWRLADETARTTAGRKKLTSNVVSAA